MACASRTDRPRIASATRCSLNGDTRMYLATAFASIGPLRPRYRGVAGAAGAAGVAPGVAAGATPVVRSAAAPVPWPLKVRVGENSPSLCPTICSVTYTGMCFRPSYTAMVCPTISGSTVLRRDQVLITRRSRLLFSSRTFFRRCSSTNGPFFVERAIGLLPPLHDELVAGLRFARLVAQRRLAPRADRSRHADGRAALTPAVGMTARVHRHTAP